MRRSCSLLVVAGKAISPETEGEVLQMGSQCCCVHAVEFVYQIKAPLANLA